MSNTFLFLTRPKESPKQVRTKCGIPWCCSDATRVGNRIWVFVTGGQGITYEWRALSDPKQDQNGRFRHVCDVEFVCDFAPPITIANFRQTVLATLPLLKEEEKAQYLIEQLSPLVEKRYASEKSDLRLKSILKVFKFFEFAGNFFATEPDVKQFMIEGANPKQRSEEATAAYEKTNKELEKVKGSPSGLLALVVVGILFFWVCICVEIFFR